MSGEHEYPAYGRRLETAAAIANKVRSEMLAGGLNMSEVASIANKVRSEMLAERDATIAAAQTEEAK